MYTTHVAAAVPTSLVHGMPSHRANSGSGTVDALVIYCFARACERLPLGSGPSTLTVIVESSLYAINGDDDEDYGLEQLESEGSPMSGRWPRGGSSGTKNHSKDTCYQLAETQARFALNTRGKGPW